MVEYFITPLFIESDIRNIVTVRTDIKKTEKLDIVDNLNKITKAYAQGTGFTRSTGVTITQKTITVNDMKAQVAQNGKAFKNYVKEALLKKGYEENNVEDTIFEEILMDIFMQGLRRDLQRQLWFGNDKKETVASDIATGTADADYNVYDGFWTRLIEDVTATTIPAAQFVDLNTTTYVSAVAVKQVATTTLTGTAGTANITVNGTAYTATFATDLTTTAANFVTSHGATIAARWHGAVVTSSGADVIFTANIAGVPISVTNAVNATGNLAGSTAATTANTVTGSLKTDAAKTAFAALYNAATPELLERIDEARFIVTSSMYNNYMATLETLNGSDAAHRTLLDGESVLAFRGIPIVVQRSWDVHIANDFGNEYPHRAILTIPRNMVVGTDGSGDDMSIEMWYEKKDQENNFRVEYKAGTQYVHEELIAVAYA